MPRRFSGAKNGFRNLPRSRAETGDDVKARDYLCSLLVGADVEGELDVLHARPGALSPHPRRRTLAGARGLV